MIEFEVSPTTWVACPMGDCGKTSRGWRNVEVHCSDCGDHPGVECPACEVVIDTVHHDLQAMLDAAVPPYRAAPGVYCAKGHMGKPVMVCDECKEIWSPCCGETHECEGPQDPVVPCSGALFPTRVDRIFRRGSKIKVRLGPEHGKVSVVGVEHDLADWPGWE